MKTENYDELMDKFYAGIANAEEISVLEREGLIDEQDISYADALNSEREQKMNWEFKDFMNEIPATKVVAHSAHRLWIKRMMAVAAVVAAMLTTYVFWPQPHQSKEIASVPEMYKQFDSNQHLIGKTVLPADEIKNTVKAEKNVKPEIRKNRNYAVQASQQKLVKNRKNNAEEKGETKTNAGDYLVMVNGKPITNEADAIAITRESLGMFSRNLTNTIDELKPIGQIKIKL